MCCADGFHQGGREVERGALLCDLETLGQAAPEVADDALVIAAGVVHLGDGIGGAQPSPAEIAIEVAEPVARRPTMMAVTSTHDHSHPTPSLSLPSRP